MKWIKTVNDNNIATTFECQLCGEVFDISHEIRKGDSIYFNEEEGCYLPLCPRCGVKGSIKD